jgi:hypothetical protein
VTESTPGSRRRSTLVLLIGAALAVALGAGAALSRRSPAPIGNPINMGIPVPATAGNVDPRVFHERLLEELVLDSADTERPDQLPSFATFSLLVTSDPEAFGWVVDRLAEPSVPDRLATAFAAHLPTRRRDLDAIVHRLLIPRLEDDDPERAGRALDVLRAGGRTRVGTDPACRCAFGHYPTRPTAGEPVWLVAFHLDGEPVSWAPEEGRGEEPGWILNLARADEGQPLLVRRVEGAPDGRWFVAVGEGAVARVVVEAEQR